MRALIFDVKRDCSEDGPGIRTTVFFKGCPLHCAWCQNPEGMSKEPQLIRAPEHTDPATTANTVETVGYYIDLDELIYRVCIDKPFFDASGGGVTVSGGEATMQMSFVHHFLKRLKQKNIHTTLETCGFFNYRRFKEKLLPYLDLIYFDVKLMDDKLSRRYTGQSNKLILRNLEKLSRESGVNLIPRIPLIPGITTTRDNLQSIARYLRQLNIRQAVLLSYNPTWLDKLPRLNLQSDYQRRTFMTTEEKQACLNHFYSTDFSLEKPQVHTGTYGES